MIYYSKTTGGFYDDAINGDGIPADAVEVTAEHHQAVMAGQSSGQVIVSDVSGAPVLVAASTLLTLAQVQEQQTAAMYAAYAEAVAQDVTFTTAAGVTKAFQADKDSAATLQATIVALQAVGAVPDGFYWKSSDNATVPVTFGDLQALARAMLTQGWAAFQHLQQRKTSIAAAATVAAVQAVVW